MQSYAPKKFSGWRIAAMILRGIVSLLRVWPLLLIVAFIVSPITPYMRWEYTYTPMGARKIMHRCTYLGKGGKMDIVPRMDCPFFILADERTRR